MFTMEKRCTSAIKSLEDPCKREFSSFFRRATVEFLSTVTTYLTAFNPPVRNIIAVGEIVKQWISFLDEVRSNESVSRSCSWVALGIGRERNMNGSKVTDVWLQAEQFNWNINPNQS